MNLLSLDGVPHEQIVAGLKDRPDADCIAAFQYFTEQGFLPKPVIKKIATMADEIRDSAKILAIAEPKFRARLEEIKIPIEAQANALELNALVVEAYVRSANAVFPLPGNN